MMLKLLVETGSERHSTSSASLRVKFANGPHSGDYLYQHREYQKTTDWHEVQNGRWVETVYELPDGTEIEVIGHGRTGNRGVNHHETHQVYRLDPEAEILDAVIDVGLRGCVFKGRVVLIQDILAEKEKNVQVSKKEGF